VRPLRLAASATHKERRLTELLARAGGGAPDLDAVVADAQLLGSLELSGYRCGWDEVRASRRGTAASAPVARLRAAQAALPLGAALGPAQLLSLARAVSGDALGFRTRERTRPEGPPPAPPEFVVSRLEQLGEWLDGPSGRELRASQAGALALARVMEILPFDEGNGRVARLLASHVMVRAVARPPVLVGGDAARLEAALQAAFRLETEPLAGLLEEASERALDVMLQTLESGRDV
jgi:hypothetical protein